MAACDAAIMRIAGVESQLKVRILTSGVGGFGGSGGGGTCGSSPFGGYGGGSSW